MDAHFRHPLAHRRAIAEVAQHRAVDSRLNPYLGPDVRQAGEPVIEYLGSENLLHELL
jgi:hypothetical protein